MQRKSWWNWLKGVFPSRRGVARRGAPPRRAARRPGLEQLETRLVPAAVLSVADATFNLGAGPAGLTVTRTGDLSPAVAVSYSVFSGTR